MSVHEDHEVQWGNAPPSALEKTVFTFLYTMCKDADHSSFFAYILLVIEDVQLISFSWVPEAIPGLPHIIPEVMYPLEAVFPHYDVFLVLFFIAIATMSATIVLATFSAISLQQGSFKWIWPLVLLRLLSSMVATVFFMPFMEIFILAVVCRPLSPGATPHLSDFPETECFTASHWPIFILAILGLLVTVPFGILVNYIYVIPTPDSRNPMAKAHGLFDVLYFILKGVLVLSSRFTSETVELIILTLINVLLIGASLHYMPYFEKRVNNLRTSLLSASFLSSMVAMISWIQLRRSDASATSVTAVLDDENPSSSRTALAVLVSLLPVGLVGGWYLSEFFRRFKVTRIMSNLELKLKMEESGDNFALRPKNIKEARTLASQRSSFLRDSGALETLERGGRKLSLFVASDAISPSDAVNTPHGVPDSAIVAGFRKEAAKKMSRPPVVLWSPHDADIACRFLRDSGASPAGLRIMKLVFEEALRQYPKNAQLSLMYTYYLARWGDNPEECLHQFSVTNTFQPSLDVRFRVFMEQRDFAQDQNAKGLAKSSLDVASYVEYQSLERRALQAHVACVVNLKQFWAEVSLPGGGAHGDVPQILSSLSRAQHEAEMTYEKLVARFPRSKKILRMYAKYLVTVTNNMDRGQQLLSLADDIESAEAKASWKQTAAQFENAHRLAAARDTGAFEAVGGTDVPGLRKDLEQQVASGSLGQLQKGAPRRPSVPLAPRTDLSEVLRKSALKESGNPLSKVFDELDRDVSTVASTGDQSPRLINEALVEGFPWRIERSDSVAQGSDVGYGSGPRKVKIVSHSNVVGEGRSYVPSPLAADSEQIGEADKDLSAFRKPKSVASSVDSSKATRKKRSRQDRLSESLTAKFQRLTHYVQICCGIVLGLLIANYVVSSTLYATASQYLNTFEDGTRARRGAILAVQEVRLMTHYAQTSPDKASWQFHHDKLLGEAGRFARLILPILFDNANDPLTFTVLRAKNSSYSAEKEVLRKNAYTLGTALSDSMGILLSLPYERWQDSALLEDVDVRMLLDNSLRIGDAFDDAAHSRLKSYISHSDNDSLKITGLMATLIVVVIVMVALIYRTLLHSHREQDSILKALRRIGNRDKRQIKDMIEEEIEQLAEHQDDHARMGFTDALQFGGRLKMRLSVKHRIMYILSSLTLTTLAIALFIPPLLFLGVTNTTATLIMRSNDRRYTFQVISFLSHELPANDLMTWAPFKVQEELYYRIWHLSDQHEATLHSGDGITTNRVPELQTVCRRGPICLADAGCGSDVRSYNDAIGFTQDFVMAGVDHLLDVFLDRAKRNLANPPYTYNSTDLYYITHLEDDLADGLRVVDELLLRVAQDKGHLYINLDKGILAGVLVYFVLFSAVIFRVILKSARLQLEQMVGILFWIPAEIAQGSADVQRFILAAEGRESEGLEN
ncbi:uncharacterized protein EV422DRAFT_523714 [Fimicolochytrium jonesii]|uniref:uncharacterized protein n=1 Tax=Fimicolochytrium jonesii TaxID=1396493 RepID=UPI0022FEA0B8|nr:uncharacterized protein EV422DRAFT_523714 [Fimicolochytrium jonesii]KAI8823194.1 hypothetical protein EV422DRAFT_523714 [Fimicolochytrium jonesii]